MVQLENEYGSYGEDKVYLKYLQSLLWSILGSNSVIYHSTDGYIRGYLLRSYIPGIFQVLL